jgi:xanthine/uracil permease
MKKGQKVRNQQIASFILLILIVILTPFLTETFSMVPLLVGTAVIGFGIVYLVGKLTKEEA